MIVVVLLLNANGSMRCVVRTLLKRRERERDAIWEKWRPDGQNKNKVIAHGKKKTQKRIIEYVCVCGVSDDKMGS